MKDLQISIKYTCEVCDGCGMVPNDDYNALGEALKAWREENPAPDYKLFDDAAESAIATAEHAKLEDSFIMDFFNQRGYNVRRIHELPAEEYCCGECDGQGSIEKWISLPELTNLVVDQIAREATDGEG